MSTKLNYHSLKSNRRKVINEYKALSKHLHFLGITIVLANHRMQKMNAKTDRIRHINARITRDENEEDFMHYYGPMQVCFCLIFGFIEKYKKLNSKHPEFQDKDIDKFVKINEENIKKLKDFRDSLIHPRPDNFIHQITFLEDFNQPKGASSFLFECRDLFKRYLKSTKEVNLP